MVYKRREKCHTIKCHNTSHLIFARRKTIKKIHHQHQGDTTKFELSSSDFKSIIKGKGFYIDKSKFIQEVIDAKNSIIIFARPKQFGKTINLSMLRYFFDNTLPKKPNLFHNMIIWNKSLKLYRHHYHKYPVISLSFKTIVYNNDFKNFIIQFGELIASIYQKQCKIHGLNNNIEYIKKLLAREADQSELSNSIYTLIDLIYNRYGQKKPIVLLIDEYDELIRKAYLIGDSASGEYKKTVNFIYEFLKKTLNNKALYRSVLAGVLPIKWDDILEEQKNFSIYTILDTDFSHSFGFFTTELEQKLPDYLKNKEVVSIMKEWYGGHHLSRGGEDCLNPWSTLNFIDDIIRSKKPLKLKSYWTDSVSVEISQALLQHANRSSKKRFKRLATGKQKLVRVPLESCIDISSSIADSSKGVFESSKLFSLLLFSGHLTVISEKNQKGVYSLKIPNEEILRFFMYVCQSFFQNLHITKTPSRIFFDLKKETSEIDEQFFNCLDDKISLDDRGLAVEKLLELKAEGALLKLANIDNFPVQLSEKIISNLTDIVGLEQSIEATKILWKKLGNGNERIRKVANIGLAYLLQVNSQEVFSFLLQGLSNKESKDLQRIEVISVLVQYEQETEQVKVTLKEVFTENPQTNSVCLAAAKALKKLEPTNIAENKFAPSSISNLLSNIPILPGLYKYIFSVYNSFRQSSSASRMTANYDKLSQSKKSVSSLTSDLTALSLVAKGSDSQSTSSASITANTASNSTSTCSK